MKLPRRLVARRPSPAMAVAVLALVVAASGTAIAAGHRVSGNSLIKKHSLSGNRLTKHSIKASRLRKNSLTGKQINLPKLGRVPHAKLADVATSAKHADTATSATSATSVSTVRTWYKTASIGQTVTLLKAGPFTYTGKCTTSTGTTYARSYVATSQNNSAASSYEGATQVPFSTSDGPIKIGEYADSQPGTPSWIGPYDGSDAQLSADGHTYVNTFLSAGTNVSGHDCVFTGYAVVITR